MKNVKYIFTLSYKYCTNHFSLVYQTLIVKLVSRFTGQWGYVGFKADLSSYKPPPYLLSPRNALRWGYSNAAVVPSVSPWFRPCVDLLNTIETTPLRVSLSNLVDMLTMMRG